MTGEGGGGEADQRQRPRLAPHVRLSQDRRRNRWVLQAPERVLVPDEIAVEILKRCDGRPVEEIVSSLAREFDAPETEIAEDVQRLLEDLARKGMMLL
jgi:pyrroloquinoline quinone biosynthesis protein D